MTEMSRNADDGGLRLAVDIGGTFTDLVAIDPAGGLRLGKALSTHDAFVSISHELTREHREFARTSTVVANAYIGPRVRDYLGDMQQRLLEQGFAGQKLAKKLRCCA